MLQIPPSLKTARSYLEQATEVYQWLMQQLFNPSVDTYAP